MKQGNSLINQVLHMLSLSAILGSGGLARKNKRATQKDAARTLEIDKQYAVLSVRNHSHRNQRKTRKLVRQNPHLRSKYGMK